MFAGRPIIGLAGGIGSGKSHVARLLEAAGCCRVDSDEMVRVAYTHPQVKQAVVERFGPDVLDPAGQVDRKVLAGIVFRDAAQRQFLEKLLHPVANRARVEVMERAAYDPAIRAYVWDSPLLFETNLNELCDEVWFIDAPRANRAARVQSRGWDEGELDRRERVQWTVEQKRDASTRTIMNSEAEPATAASLALILEEVAPEPAGCCGSEGACGSGCQSSSGGCGCATAGAAGTAESGAGTPTKTGGCCGGRR